MASSMSGLTIAFGTSQDVKNYILWEITSTHDVTPQVNIVRAGGLQRMAEALCAHNMPDCEKVWVSQDTFGVLGKPKNKQGAFGGGFNNWFKTLATFQGYDGQIAEGLNNMEQNEKMALLGKMLHAEWVHYQGLVCTAGK